MIFAVVPMKRLGMAKSRLRAALGSSEREELVLQMLRQVLHQLALVPGLSGRLVVTADEAVASAARAAGAEVLHEAPEGGLNQALIQAAAWLHRHRAGRIMVVPGDLPLALARDFERLLQATACDGEMAIVRARDGAGTGALLCSLPLPFNPRFGPGSFERHCQAATAAGLRPLVLDLPRIAHDLDQPADLEMLATLRARIRRSAAMELPLHG